MILYKKINLRCYIQLKEYALKHSMSYYGKPDGMEFHNFPIYLKKMLDDEMIEKGLGHTKPPLYFYKKNIHEFSHESCHIDGNALNITNLSLILPIRGCENTKQYWYSGKYSLSVANESNVSYIKISWNEGPPTLLDTIEICDAPLLCNVSIPHAVVTNETEQRVTCTIRFQKNWSMEEIKDLDL